MLHWRQVKHRWCQFFSPEYDHHIDHGHDHIDDNFYHIDDDDDNVDDDHDQQNGDFLLTASSQDILGFSFPLTT